MLRCHEACRSGSSDKRSCDTDRDHKAAKPRHGRARPKKGPVKARSYSYRQKAINAKSQLVDRGSTKQKKAQIKAANSRNNAAERLIQAFQDGKEYSQTAVLTKEDRAKIHNDRQAARPQNTAIQYNGQLKKFEFFCERGDAAGLPYNPDLTVKGGLVVAVKFMQWVGEGMPGFDYRKKPSVMSRPLREAIRSGMQSYYADLQAVPCTGGDAVTLMAYTPL